MYPALTIQGEELQGGASSKDCIYGYGNGRTATKGAGASPQCQSTDDPGLRYHAKLLSTVNGGLHKVSQKAKTYDKSFAEKQKYSSIDPREQKHAKDFSRLHPALATAPIFTAWRLSTTRTASASTRHLTAPAPAPAPSTQPAPAPCLHHVRSQLTCTASSQHRRPAPCLHHAHSQPASTQHRHPAPRHHQHQHRHPAPAPVSTTCAASSQHQHRHPAPAPATCLESAHGQLVVI